MQTGEPQLYWRYRRNEIMALFGADGGGKMFGEGQWVILPAATICMTTLGDPRAHPHFESAVRFRWVAENPQGDEPRFAVETFQGKSRQPSQATIWLFVRRPEWDDYLYAGRLASPNSWGHRAGSWHVSFELSPALPTAVWTTLQGVPPADRAHVTLDAMLSGLGPSTTTQVRFATLQAVVEYWHGKIVADDGLPDAALDGTRMPLVLKQWYRWAGRRTDILSGQNFLLAPDRLRIEDGRLFFYQENQYCYLWATLPEGNDPPVFGREDERDAWQPEGMLLSEHLILPRCSKPSSASRLTAPPPYGSTITSSKRSRRSSRLWPLRRGDGAAAPSSTRAAAPSWSPSATQSSLENTATMSGSAPSSKNRCCSSARSPRSIGHIRRSSISRSSAGRFRGGTCVYEDAETDSDPVSLAQQRPLLRSNLRHSGPAPHPHNRSTMSPNKIAAPLSRSLYIAPQSLDSAGIRHHL
jgi:hypothetical protein